MEVFTDELLQNLKRRYEKSGVEPPPLYRLATLDEWKPHRKTIQEWIDNLSENSQKKIIGKLTNSKSFYHTYNELKIASLLFEKYSTIEYEEELLGVTPDWTVKNQSGEILFIVEVLTRENSNKDKSVSKRTDELKRKISDIRIGVGLHLSYGDDFDEKQLDSKLIKQIFSEIEKWLAKRPAIGAIKIVKNFEFEIIRYNEKWNTVQILGPAKTLWVDNVSLKDNIEEKIRKYRNLIEKEKVPFVVGIVPEFSTGVSKDTLEDILFGQEVYVFNEDTNTADFFDRKPDGVFAQRKNISAVIGYFDGKSEIFHNPNATLPLPAVLKVNES